MLSFLNIITFLVIIHKDALFFYFIFCNPLIIPILSIL